MMRVAAVLNSPLVWDLMRNVLDRTYGLYRHRMDVIREWGVLGENSTLLDVGCGTGHYARIAPGRYVGIDIDERYIRHARKKYPEPRFAFRCADLAVLATEDQRFDAVLAVDVLHHLQERVSLDVLRMCRRLTSGHVLSFEPVTEQANRVGKWIIQHDRGDYIRPEKDTIALLKAGGLELLDVRTLALGPERTLAALCR